jgi:hypothetical protein
MSKASSMGRKKTQGELYHIYICVKKQLKLPLFRGALVHHTAKTAAE